MGGVVVPEGGRGVGEAVAIALDGAGVSEDCVSTIGKSARIDMK